MVTRTGSGIALTVATVFGNAPAVADDNLFFSELPVVASVSRLPQRQVDAPTAVTVIDRETIKAAGVRALNDVFRLVPGFQTFPHNTDPARVTYHGITDEDFSPRVQVLVDGRSLHSPLFRSGVNWALMPVALEDIERIEVVRGSNTTSYGTNAFLGVINIVTVDPALVRGVSVAANHGSQGVRDYTLRAGAQLGEDGDFRLTYQQLDDNGLENQYDWIDSFRSRLLDLRASWRLGVRDGLELNAGRIEGVLTKGRLDKDFVNAQGELYRSDPGNPIRDFDQSSSWLQLRWLRTLSENSDFSLRYAYSVDEARDDYVDPELPAGFAHVDETGDRGSRNEIEAVHTFAPFAKTRLVWGGSWREDTLRSKTMLYGEGKVVREVSRAFANAEWTPLAWFTGNAGVSTEYDSLAGNNMSSRASGSFHITSQNTFRIGYARGWRTASILDYRANYRSAADEAELTGNRRLPAERLDSWEVGYLGDWKDWNMSLDVRRFQEHIRDRLFQIDPNRRDDLGDSMFPIQDIRIDGVEYQWKWQPLARTRLAVAQSFVSIGSDYTQEVQAQPFGTLTSRDRRRRIDALARDSAPRRASSLLWIQKLPYGLEGSVARYWVDPMKWTRNTEARGYVRTDARLAYPFRAGTQGGEIAWTVQSLNGDHGEFKADGDRADRVVGRRHWVSLRLDF
ncbi:TonB-dependent receptor plug domain-containing protein [Aromatoleum petrolei]|uniref:TonB-dependent receptor plug domain-containing protein n=1 Tax=Aromatoleum petrolei TaxID=76116 RepID=UPI001FD00529|nr:TonB-dependent receptor [Aromatoleum petrolei]